MKIISYGALCAICLAQAALARAELSFHLNTSSTNIESNPPSVSKPAYPKYASVSFLQSDSKLDFKSGEVDVKTQCASMGYVIPVSKCTGAMKPSRLCSAESSMKSVAGADGYTTGCCNSNLYTALSPDACANNSTSLNDSCYYDGSKKYRCSCDRARYPYSNSDNTTCGLGGEFDVSDVCVAPNAQGQDISYYSGCCPNSYQECDANNHEVGLGKSCRVQSSKGVVNRYESCTCASHYDTVCSDGKLINVDNVCKRNGLNYTTESNCESLCTKTSETNVDDTLYQKIWHCLYEPDGATIKTTEGGLCNFNGSEEATGKYKNFYTNCETQGFTKSVEDCYNASAILYCPADKSKVWCVESKYCTGYDVSGDACNLTTANVTMCPSASADKLRCRYNNTDCNNGWSEGTYSRTVLNLTSAQTALNDKGMLNTCCKEGYRFENGKCVANVCSNIRYPYATNPGTEAGQREECSQADTARPLGYSKHYGFTDCYTEDNTEYGQGMWKRKSNNSSSADYHKCVCERNSTKKTGLPFDVSNYYEQNTSTPIGFNKGAYGHSTSCTDEEGSYYGYKDCYIGYNMGTGDNKYKCEVNEAASYCVAYPYLNSDQVNNFLTQNNIASSTVSSNYNPRTSSEAFCVNRYEHYIDRQGNRKGDDSVAALLIEGCDNGTESACNECYHVANLEKVNGLWHAHNRFKLKVNRFETQVNYGFEQCPDGFFKGAGDYGSCGKYCDANNLASCSNSDILRKNGIVIGVVLSRESHRLDISSVQYANKTFDEAIAYSNSYAPTGLENDATFGRGKWHMPIDSDYDNSCDFSWRGTAAVVGSNPNFTWYNYTNGEYGLERGRCGYSSWRLKSSPFNIYPMMQVTF